MRCGARESLPFARWFDAGRCAIRSQPRPDPASGGFSRVGFLVRHLGERTHRKRFGGFSWTQGGPLGSNSRERQLTDASSYGQSLAAGFFQECSRFAFPTFGKSKALLPPKRLMLLCFALSFDAWFPAFLGAERAVSSGQDR